MRARAGLLCLAMLGLAALLGRVSSGSQTPFSLAASFSLFVVAVLFANALVARRRLPRCEIVKVAGTLGVLAIASALWSHPVNISAATLLGAAAEELVFRRELPAALHRLLRGPCRTGREGLAAVLMAQVVFAASHWATGSSAAPAVSAVRLVSLAAAGVCLAVLYRFAGTLVLPALVHWWINEARRNSLLGALTAPVTDVALACAALLGCGVIGSASLRGRQ